MKHFSKFLVSCNFCRHHINERTAIHSSHGLGVETVFIVVVFVDLLKKRPKKKMKGNSKCQKHTLKLSGPNVCNLKFFSVIFVLLRKVVEILNVLDYT